MFLFESWQKHQPVGITGLFTHTALWLTSSFHDIVYQNPRFQPSASDDNGIAIYCIHGTGDRASSFSVVAQRLLNRLPPTISTVHLIAFDHRGEGIGIEMYAEQLKNKIKDHDQKKIILMGHSRGGLISAWFTEYLAREIHSVVLGVINICTPFGGSTLARPPLSWLSASIKQMEKNSDFLRELTAKIRSSDKKYFYFAAQNDYFVSLYSTYIKENCQSLVVLDGHGHLSIMSSHRLVEYILAHLHSLSA